MFMAFLRSYAPLLCLLLAAPLICSDSSGNIGERLRLPAGETLHYRIEWRLFTAGKAQLSFKAGLEARWHTGLQVESTGLVSKLYKIQDQYSSTLNAELCAESSQMIAHEGSRHRETNITFNSAAGKASYVEKDLSNSSVASTKEISIPACVHDVVGGLYRLRTLSLAPGTTRELPVSDGKKSVSARIEVQGREEIKTPSGTYKTVRCEAFLFNDVLYRRPARLYFWLTDDDAKIPVQIQVRMQFTIGTITLQLEKIEHAPHSLRQQRHDPYRTSTTALDLHGESHNPGARRRDLFEETPHSPVHRYLPRSECGGSQSLVMARNPNWPCRCPRRRSYGFLSGTLRLVWRHRENGD